MASFVKTTRLASPLLARLQARRSVPASPLGLTAASATRFVTTVRASHPPPPPDKPSRPPTVVAGHDKALEPAAARPIILRLDLGANGPIPLIRTDEVLNQLLPVEQRDEVLIPAEDFPDTSGLTLELPNFFTPGGPVHLYTLLPDIPGDGLRRETLIRVIAGVYKSELEIANQFRRIDGRETLLKEELVPLRLAPQVEWWVDQKWLKPRIERVEWDVTQPIGF